MKLSLAPAGILILLLMGMTTVCAVESTIVVEGSSCRFVGGEPQLTLVDSAQGTLTTWSPTGDPIVSEEDRATPAGPARATTQRWDDPRGYRVTWTVTRLRDRPAVTLQMSFENRTPAPVVLREFRLLGGASTVLRVDGAAKDWWLSTLDSHDSSVGGYNPSADLAKPQTLRFLDTLTLYTDLGRRGMLIGAVGPAVSDVRLRCQVAATGPQVDIISEMNDVLVDPGVRRVSEEVVILPEAFDGAATTLLRWLAATHGSRTARGPLTGWCSWYDRGKRIDQDGIGRICDTLAERRAQLPLQVVQIDDGWQKAYGDWTADPAKFPDGMAAMAKRIKDAGAIPGIWLCPNRTSAAGAHPDGSDHEWQDASHPAVQAFVRTSLADRVAEGYRYFKLDFLWIRNLESRHDRRKTRLEICRDINRIYREAIGEDSYLVSCVGGFNRGCFGYADAARIGTDTTKSMGSLYRGCSLANSINAVGSTALSNGILFANDPDVPYLGVEQDPLLRTWYSFVGLQGGLVLTSEPLHHLNPTALLRHEQLLPPAPNLGRAFDGQTDPWHRRFGFVAERPWDTFAAVLLWNPTDGPADLTLDGVPVEKLGKRFHVWSFWDERYLGTADASFTVPGVASHDHALLRLTPARNDGPVLIGSTLHVAMGSAEVREVRRPPNRTIIDLTDAGARAGALYVHSTKPLCLGTVLGCRAELQSRGEGVWKVAISDRRRGEPQSIELADSRSAADAVTPRLFKRDRHEGFLKRKAEGPIGLVLLGDSITDGWSSKGGAAWTRLAPHHPADFGVSAMRTEGLLWNVTNGELDGLKPKAVVILIGVNNLLQCPDEQPEWVAAGVRAVVEAVRSRTPEARILLLGILPARNPATHPARARISAVNRLLPTLADGQTVRYLDFGSVFLDEAGLVRKDLMPDGVHPNEAGYQAWYDAMMPVLGPLLEGP